MIEKYIEAMQKGDYKALAACFAPKCRYFDYCPIGANHDNYHVYGREAIEMFFHHRQLPGVLLRQLLLCPGDHRVRHGRWADSGAYRSSRVTWNPPREPYALGDFRFSFFGKIFSKKPKKEVAISQKL